MRSKPESSKTLILGIGNILMGDEGVGVRVVEALADAALPADVDVLDGGVGSFLLLEPMQNAREVVLIDATIDGAPPGTVRRIRPKFSSDYPRTLTAHDIGLKDLIDTFYMLGDTPEVTLFAVSIDPLGEVSMDLSPAIAAAVPKVAEMVVREVSAKAAEAA